MLFSNCLDGPKSCKIGSKSQRSGVLSRISVLERNKRCIYIPWEPTVPSFSGFISPVFLGFKKRSFFHSFQGVQGYKLVFLIPRDSVSGGEARWNHYGFSQLFWYPPLEPKCQLRFQHFGVHCFTFQNEQDIS